MYIVKAYHIYIFTVIPIPAVNICQEFRTVSEYCKSVLLCILIVVQHLTINSTHMDFFAIVSLFIMWWDELHPLVVFSKKLKRNFACK